MTACDVFVQPPREEAFGLVFAEASSAACPIVSTSVGGIPEIVKHGETGTLVPCGDVPALAAAVLTLLREPGLRQEMGSRARVRAQAHFSSEAMTSAYAALIHRLLIKPSTAIARGKQDAADASNEHHCSNTLGTKP